MVEFVLNDDDLTGLRFAVSPLNELTLSLRVLRDPGRYPLHLPWSRGVLRRESELDTEILGALVNDRGWTPDFLSPRPVSPFTRLADELDQVRATPREVIRRDLHSIHATSPPDVDGNRIADAMAGYWNLGLEPHWPRIRAVLENDIAHRGRSMVQHGLGTTLADISDRITWDSPVIRVRITGLAPRRVEVGGGGLTLLPTVFALHTAIPVDPTAPPMLIYAARGVGTLWERPPATSPTALVAVLGRVRTDLLVTLTEPASSTDLARRDGVTTSAVNQHLRALRATGLVTSHRHGSRVLYQRSDLGDALVLASALPG